MRLALGYLVAAVLLGTILLLALDVLDVIDLLPEFTFEPESGYQDDRSLGER